MMVLHFCIGSSPAEKHRRSVLTSYAHFSLSVEFSIKYHAAFFFISFLFCFWFNSMHRRSNGPKTRNRIIIKALVKTYLLHSNFTNYTILLKILNFISKSTYEYFKRSKTILHQFFFSDYSTTPYFNA